MRESDYNLLIEKADELRSLFVLGQKVIPFMEDIFRFLKETQPMFEEINESISENLQKMPSASMQLSKVTQESEKTTNEIMDLVDNIIQNAEKLQTSSVTTKSDSSPIKILKLLSSAIEEGKDLKPTLPMLSKAIDYLDTPQSQTDSETASMVSQIMESANSIMMSLQIQDITSQQLASVDHLLKSLQQKMKMILEKFNDEDIDELVPDNTYSERTNVTELHRTIAFDSEAVNNYSESGKQDEIDAIFDGGLDGFDEIDQEIASTSPDSNEPEDALEDNENTEIHNTNLDEEDTTEFNDSLTALDTEPIIESDQDSNIPSDLETDTVEESESDDDSEPLITDDISDSDDDTQFSQDDIDALFGG